MRIRLHLKFIRPVGRGQTSSYSDTFVVFIYIYSEAIEDEYMNK